MCPVTAGGVEWLLGSRTLGSNQETAAICIRTVTMATGREGGRGGEGERERSVNKPIVVVWGLYHVHAHYYRRTIIVIRLWYNVDFHIP